MTKPEDKELREVVDAIIFRCFDQGVYWGKLAYSDNERPDKPDKPIDRTEAVNTILAALQRNTEAAVEKAKQEGFDIGFKAAGGDVIPLKYEALSTTEGTE